MSDPVSDAGRGPVGVAGVDIGGSGIRVRVEPTGQGSNPSKPRGVDGAGLAEDTAVVPRGWWTRDAGRAAVVERIVSVVRRTAASLGLAGVPCAAIGTTGLPGLVTRPDALWPALRARLDLDTLVVASDALTTHVGALGFRPGAVIAAGTGAIALGTDHREVWNRVDGWGYLLGDLGSGAWVGAAGLRAALRAHDGRPDGSATLLARLTDRFGTPATLLQALYGEDRHPAQRLAAFAPAVADAARSGDPIALGIWQAAGARLAETAIAASVGLPALFSWGGRLFEAADLVLPSFRAALAAARKDGDLVTPQGTSVDGALALARSAERRSLRAHPPYLYVFRAGQGRSAGSSSRAGGPCTVG